MTQLTFAQIQKLNAMTAAIATAQRPTHRGNPAKRTLQWTMQLAHERQIDRPEVLEAHDFTTDLGGLVDRSQLCTTCQRPFDHGAHQRTQPSASVDTLIDAVQNGTIDDLLEESRTAEHGDADEREGQRPASTDPSPLRIAPRELTGLSHVGQGVYVVIRVTEPGDRGETERELDFLSPHRGSQRPKALRCTHCKGTVRQNVCTACSREQGLKPRLVSELPHLDFIPFAGR